MLHETLINILKTLNDDVTSNPEYLRGQLEMANALLGYVDDGFIEKLGLMKEAFPESTHKERMAVA